MGLISSRTLKGEKEDRMAEKKLADKDITIKDGAGRRVLVVAKGQPIPDNLDEVKKQYGEVQRLASDEEIAEARGETPKRSGKKK